jgi:hypothetical protein
MSEIMYSSWSCQNCFQLYSSQADLRNHVEAYEVCGAPLFPTILAYSRQKLLAQYYLKMAQGALQHSAHFFLGTSFPEGESVQEDEDEIADSGHNTEKDAKLTCPHPTCRDAKIVYTQKRNLQRHFSRRTTLSSRD